MIDTDGHIALIPVNLGVGGHSLPHPNDPVAVSGYQAAHAVSGITDFCKHLKVPVPPLDSLLPPSLFPETGNLLAQLRRLSSSLSKYQYIRMVDKELGELWGFRVEIYQGRNDPIFIHAREHLDEIQFP